MKTKRNENASILFSFVLLLICAQALPSQEPWQVRDQSYCEYWIRHFDAIHKLEKEIVESKNRQGLRPVFKLWLHRQKMKRRLLRAEWDAFGEMVDRAERIYPDDEPNPDSDNYYNGGRRW